MLAIAGSAKAQTPCAERARVDLLEEEGQALRRGRRDAEALQRFEQAWNLCHEPRSMVRRGLAEWALGRWLDAEAHVTEGLSHRDDPWVRANHEAITREDLAAIRSHLGSIELVGSTGRGEVQVGGRRVASWPSPGPIRVVSGENLVVVEADGYHPWRRTVVVPAGGLARENVELVTTARPAPAPTPATTATNANHTEATPAPLPRAATAPSPHDTGAPNTTLRTLAWTGTVLTLALGATAIATFVLYNDAVGEFGPVPLPANPSASVRYCISPLANEVSECQSIASRRDTMGTVALTTGITAGALAIGTAVLWAQSARGGTRQPEARARWMGCAPTVGEPGVHCAFRF